MSKQFHSSAEQAAHHFEFFPQISDALLPVIAAILLYARRDSESSDVTPDVPFVVREISDKGFGAFATRNIAYVPLMSRCRLPYAHDDPCSHAQTRRSHHL